MTENTFVTNCKYCGSVYTAQRKTSKYCSDKCRLKANRQRDNSVNTELEIDKACDAIDRLLNLSDERLLHDASYIEVVYQRAKQLHDRREALIDKLFGVGLQET